eukprot:3733881-Prymnesium_polylepis.2
MRFHDVSDSFCADSIPSRRPELGPPGSATDGRNASPTRVMTSVLPSSALICSSSTMGFNEPPNNTVLGAARTTMPFAGAATRRCFELT